MQQIYDVGPTALFLLRKKACRGFFRPQNPNASAGFELANLGTKGQHATPIPPKLLLVNLIHKNYYNVFKQLKSFKISIVAPTCFDLHKPLSGIPQSVLSKITMLISVTYIVI